MSRICTVVKQNEVNSSLKKPFPRYRHLKFEEAWQSHTKWNASLCGHLRFNRPPRVREENSVHKDAKKTFERTWTRKDMGTTEARASVFGILTRLKITLISANVSFHLEIISWSGITVSSYDSHPLSFPHFCPFNSTTKMLTITQINTSVSPNYVLRAHFAMSEI